MDVPQRIKPPWSTLSARQAAANRSSGFFVTAQQGPLRLAMCAEVMTTGGKHIVCRPTASGTSKPGNSVHVASQPGSLRPESQSWLLTTGVDSSTMIRFCLLLTYRRQDFLSDTMPTSNNWNSMASMSLLVTCATSKWMTIPC